MTTCKGQIMSQGRLEHIKEPDSIKFALNGVQSRELQRRKHNLDLVCKRARELAGDRQSELLKGYLPIILRLASVCPFEDVRIGCAKLLQELKEAGEKVPRRVYVGPSSFIPSKEVISLTGNKDDTDGLLVESFLASGRLTHVHWLMGYHPQYLECFLNTHFYLMREEGPLPFDWRCYIAILAASRHRCCYLVKLYESEFLKNKGDPTWLKGLDHIPKKLYNLHIINKILAHQPWTVNSDHMKELREGGKDSWSLSELVQAITILIHFHCLSSFVFGCGVTPEVDLEGGHTFRPPSLTTEHDCNGVDHSADEGRSKDNKEFVALMNAVSEKHKEQAEISVDKIREEFDSIASQEVVTCISYTEDPCKSGATFAHYLRDPTFRYKNYADREDRSQSLNVNEYSWEGYGFSLVDRFYPEMGQLLDEKFRVCETLTYNTVGTEESVDTRTFRQATWNYIHVLFGLFHDDYRYDEVNSLMERSYKAYIKKIVCYPEQTTQDDYLNFIQHLTHSEKVHINLITFEARMQAELLYALRAVMR